jgi:hypothetical protein
VVFISRTPTDWLTEVVRGMCGDPSAAVTTPRHATVDAVVRGIVQAGRRPVLLAGSRSELTRYGGQVRQIMRLRTTIDGSALTKPPLNVWPLKLNVWMSEPSP